MSVDFFKGLSEHSPLEGWLKAGVVYKEKNNTKIHKGNTEIHKEIRWHLWCKATKRDGTRIARIGRISADFLAIE